jgi:3-hydroxymyristoyl/3-hydroxydecanoyl-(acyl carrier protein) dehydratase
MNEIAARIVVAPDHPSLAGHFPGQPIVPGVVLLDEVLAVIRAALDCDVRLVSIVSTKFMQAVQPATRLDVHVRLTDEAGQTKARFVCSRDGVSVLEGSFLLARERAGAA